jgi:hypothetical protein
MHGAGKLLAVGGYRNKNSLAIYPRIFHLSIQALEKEFDKHPDIPLIQISRLCSYLSVPYQDSAENLHSRMVTQILFV